MVVFGTSTCTEPSSTEVFIEVIVTSVEIAAVATSSQELLGGEGGKEGRRGRGVEGEGKGDREGGRGWKRRMCGFRDSGRNGQEVRRQEKEGLLLV